MEWMIYIGSGIFMILLGLFIRVKQPAWLVAGYNTMSREERTHWNFPAMCRALFWMLALMGALLLAGGIALLLNAPSHATASVVWILFIAIAIGGVLFVNISKRFRVC